MVEEKIPVLTFDLRIHTYLITHMHTQWRGGGSFRLEKSKWKKSYNLILIYYEAITIKTI